MGKRGPKKGTPNPLGRPWKIRHRNVIVPKASIVGIPGLHLEGVDGDAISFPAPEAPPDWTDAAKGGDKIWVTQAQRIFARFGGPLRLVEALHRVGRPRTPAVVYRWGYPKEKGGRGGTIPPIAWDDIQLAARLEGIVLTPEDMIPGGFMSRREMKKKGLEYVDKDYRYGKKESQESAHHQEPGEGSSNAPGSDASEPIGEDPQSR